MGLFDKIFGNYSKKELAKIEPIKNKVLELESKYADMSDEELGGQTAILRGKLDELSTLDDVLPDALAVCREAAFRVLGKKPYPVQIIGAIVLHQGRIAEMKTGEGKTLVACLAAYANSLTGKGVHVVTVNDYLAKFQSEEMGKVFHFLNTSIGVVLTGMNKEQKREAYNADITYGTNNEFGFDYLRDNMVIYKKDKVQREHAFAIVDEVDSILIDEARTPLIISGQGDKSTKLYSLADRFAKTLKPVTVVEMDDKADNDLLDGDYIIDEKAKTATLTKSGVKKAEKAFNVINLMDADNMTLAHHINQAIKANGVMKKDIDYVVKDGEVLIVDEFTGRIMQGRRFNDGLHQAIEAKEGVEIARESKTIATITYQNYFRLYGKLSGMTGTALTEEDEFREIYKLDVIEIPTNKPVIRIDHPDVVFKTEKGKFNAVIEQVIECHKKGQPVLVGTVSVEKSEYLSRLLKNKGIKHEVLNAKHHDREAMIVAQAGKYGAVTIATNMAGRGTDIMLGGNAEYKSLADLQKMGYSEEVAVEAAGFSNTQDEEVLAARAEYKKLYAKYSDEVKELAEKVREAGGLYIIGTERHESRRIYYQLRGRSGRQGDPGYSVFYVSFDDELMQRFAGEKLQSFSNYLDDDMAIENKMVSKAIENAQKRVEGQNFDSRKHILEYDDVMRQQREIMYKERDEIMSLDNLDDIIKGMFNQAIEMTINRCTTHGKHDEVDVDAVLDFVAKNYMLLAEIDAKNKDVVKNDSKKLLETLTEICFSQYQMRLNKDIDHAKIVNYERSVLLGVIDYTWINHIDAMTKLRNGIYLRAYAQKNPLSEYTEEAFYMFEQMKLSIVDMISKNIVHMGIRPGSSAEENIPHLKLEVEFK